MSRKKRKAIINNAYNEMTDEEKRLYDKIKEYRKFVDETKKVVLDEFGYYDEEKEDMAISFIMNDIERFDDEIRYFNEIKEGNIDDKIARIKEENQNTLDLIIGIFL